MAAFMFVATNTQQMRVSHSYFFTYERREERRLRRRRGNMKTAISPVSVSGFDTTHINANIAHIWVFGSTFMDLYR